MNKIVNKIKSSAIVKNDGKNFLHFFLAFTVIFVALTLIIIQVMRSGLYKGTDQNLQDLSQNPDFLSSLVIHQKNSDGTNSPVGGDYGPTNSVLFYDANGKLMTLGSSTAVNGTSSTSSDEQSTTYNLEKAATFNKKYVGTIRSVSVHNPYGANLNYRYLTQEWVTQSGLTGYIQIFTNVDQLRESLQRNTLIVITTMTIFWLISILISLYLANWTLQPIMLAYEKQKEFVENASHELRTPLAILQNRLELLFQNPTATIIDESENISESLSEVRNMRLLTTNLLNLARRDSSIKIEPQETSAEFFESIFSNYGMLAEDAEKEFVGTVKVDGKVNLDQSLVKQLMTIIFDNAMKYTNDDGALTIDVAKVGGFLNITVADNGEGISDEDKKRIFDRFYRVDKARTRQKGGLGLGLSLAKQIVDAYNGKITVEDNQPKGTKFIIKLKLENAGAIQARIFQKL
ncbi:MULTISPECIES: cell wall metabolism sensor histidine kinase WalK [unclassified Lactococcus]|uniref:sensor histidine kinase n=1 Tax=unclassified Lactococcus TaxID=2643510 RepID=UPI0011C7E357|nr:MULTISPECIES: HAMP domain-containing sensor histidine kinase [unclassified Lactococcus]MQW22501.1 sensor histidine kinase [Lactococcus sp. dk101]TXK45525.1 HAMP domain-containing histidine kinase [Lactococcus sp. dk310]TXK51376.1 HAMP domain-containing histidine kinase [Lactococcus sp. dk322]